MSSHLLIEAAGPTVMLTAVIGIGAAVNALTSVLRTWIEQVSRTRRLIRALEDSRPHQRPGIIRACSQLEGTVGANRAMARRTEGPTAANGPHRQC